MTRLDRSAVLLGLAALACGERQDVTILEGHAYSPVGSEAVAYVSLRNSGPADDTLLGVASPLADTVTLHDSRQESGLVRMTPLEQLVVPAGLEARMAPGGLHLMLSGLKSALPEGGRLPLRLRFARTGVIEIEVPILRYGTAH